MAEKEVEDVEVSKEEVKPKVKDRYEITEIITETGIAVKDNKTNKIFTQDGLLTEILNKLDKIERAVA